MPLNEAHSCCHFCGSDYQELVWPRACGACGQLAWNNPLPVVVAIIPIVADESAITVVERRICAREPAPDAGPGRRQVEVSLMVIRRGIEPDVGTLALPSGYIDMGETWQEAACREVLEETGLNYDPKYAALYDVISVEKCVLTFVRFRVITLAMLADTPFTPNHEVTERTNINAYSAQLAWKSHQAVARRILGS